jgi:hypothetical protein
MLRPMGSVTTMPQRPDPRRRPHPYALNVRVSAGQYAVLLAIAERDDIPVSAALRLLLDREIDRLADGDETLAAMIRHAQSVEPEGDWSERHDQGAA